MLTKSRKSAAVMAAIVLLTTFTVYLVAQNMVSSSGLLDVARRPELFSAAEMAIGLAILLAVFAVCVALGGFLIYPLDESHFGLRATAKWLVVGILSGLALHGLALLLPLSSSAGEGISAPLANTLWRILRFVLAPIALYLAYWLVFRLPARLRKRGVKDG